MDLLLLLGEKLRLYPATFCPESLELCVHIGLIRALDPRGLAFLPICAAKPDPELLKLCVHIGLVLEPRCLALLLLGEKLRLYPVPFGPERIEFCVYIGLIRGLDPR